MSWSPRGKSVRPMEPLEQHVANLRQRLGAWKKHNMPRRVSGQCKHIQLDIAEMHLVAPAASASAQSCARWESQTSCSAGHAVDPERSSSCGPSTGTPVRSTSAATPPAWSIWPCVTRILASVSFSSSSTRGCVRYRRPDRSPRPGGCSHQKMVQFCSKGVTGTICVAHGKTDDWGSGDYRTSPPLPAADARPYTRCNQRTSLEGCQPCSITPCPTSIPGPCCSATIPARAARDQASSESMRADLDRSTPEQPA